MAFSPTLSHVVLVITGGVLFYAALTDFKYFKIRNELILVLPGSSSCMPCCRAAG
jgi:hypothetical protein